MSEGDNTSEWAIDEGEALLFATATSFSEIGEDINDEGLSGRKRLVESCRIGLGW